MKAPIFQLEAMGLYHVLLLLIYVKNITTYGNINVIELNNSVRINLTLFSTVVPAVVFFCPVGLSLL